MQRRRQPDYTDSKGTKHVIEQEGYIQRTSHTGGYGVSSDFMPTGIYIDGKRWAEFDDMGMAGDLNELAEKEIEKRVSNLSHPPP